MAVTTITPGITGQHLIAGRWHSPVSHHFESHNPARLDEVIGIFPEATAEVAETAVAIAQHRQVIARVAVGAGASPADVDVVPVAGYRNGERSAGAGCRVIEAVPRQAPAAGEVDRAVALEVPAAQVDDAVVRRRGRRRPPAHRADDESEEEPNEGHLTPRART